MTRRMMTVALVWAAACGEDSIADGAGDPETEGGSTTEVSGESSGTTSGSTGADASSSSGMQSEEASSGGESGWTVSGVVTRSAPIAARNDGIGDLDIGLFTKCSANVVASDEVAVYRMEHDLSDDAVQIPFTVEPPVPDGEYFLIGFFDDNQNFLRMGAADSGDLVTYGGGVDPGCVTVVVAGSDSPSHEVDLNFAIP